MLVYSLSAEDSSLEYFTVNKSTGVITTKRMFSPELLGELPTFSLVAHAEDQGSPPKSDKVGVEIVLSKPGQPKFNKSTPEKQTLEIMEESTDQKQFPAAELPDENRNEGNVTYSITGGSGVDDFCIPDPLVNILRPIYELDREANASYTLIIAAEFCNYTLNECSNLTSDCETESNDLKHVAALQTYPSSDTVLTSNEILLTIILEDINDEPPTIENDNIDGYIIAGVRDDTEYGYELFQVQAQDKDTTSKLEYSMSPSDNSLFMIDSDTGQVFGKGFLYKDIDYSNPDNWKKQEFEYTIQVTDENSTVTGESTTTTNSKIRILSRFEHILLIFNKSVESIKDEQQYIVKDLEDNFDVNIFVESISPRTTYMPIEVDSEKSEMMVIVLSNEGRFYTYDEFKNLTSCDKESTKDIDDCKLVPIQKLSSTQNDVLGLVMIVFASTILVGSCILLYFIVYSFEEYEQARRNNVLRESMIRKKHYVNGVRNFAFENESDISEGMEVKKSNTLKTDVDEVGQDMVYREDDLLITSPTTNVTENVYESMEQLTEFQNEHDGNDDNFDPSTIDWDNAIVPMTPNGTRKTTVARVYVDSGKGHGFNSFGYGDDGLTKETNSRDLTEGEDEEEEEEGADDEYSDSFIIAPGTIDGTTDDETIVSEDHEVFRDSPDKVGTDHKDHSGVIIDDDTGEFGKKKTSNDFVSIPMSSESSSDIPDVELKKVHFMDDVQDDDDTEDDMTAL
ncbi:uncharacterized protein [Antedon mediterranea]|uniref:uncharacterized protein n=1 Tax=Antedon mediterranea TaxID=105859 RepID=UPI003AF6E687